MPRKQKRMVIEYLDIVDESDRIIGRDTRDKVHAIHAIHRGVHVLVINATGEILVQKRAKARKDYAGYWDASVGAQVSSGETYEETARREIKEELGVKIDGLELVCDYHAYSDRQRENRGLFVCHHNGPFVLDPTETESVQFKKVNDIKVMIKKGEKFTQGFIKSLELYERNRC